MKQHTDPAAELMQTIDRMQVRIETAWDAILALEAKFEVMDSPRLTEQAVTRPTASTLALMAELKAWRLEKFRTTGVKAHHIFSNRTMAAIAANLPADRYELSLVHGMGQKKLEDYGDDILAIVKRHAQAGGGGDW